MMERVLGPLPPHMLKRVEFVFCHPFFVSVFRKKGKCIFCSHDCFSFFVWILRSVDLLRNTSEGADLIGLKGLHLGKALKLFKSYFVFRYSSQVF